MARSLKIKGREELGSLRARVIRQYGLKRIYRADHDKLIELINALDARIVSMPEVEEGKEESL